jgi:hypothetical protein
LSAARGFVAARGSRSVERAMPGVVDPTSRKHGNIAAIEPKQACLENVLAVIFIGLMELVFSAVGYATARMLLPALTFGRVTVEVPTPPVGFNWLGFRRLADGRLLCASDIAMWIGILFWTGVLVAIVALV